MFSPSSTWAIVGGMAWEPKTALSPVAASGDDFDDDFDDFDEDDFDDDFDDDFEEEDDFEDDVPAEMEEEELRAF